MGLSAPLAAQAPAKPAAAAPQPIPRAVFLQNMDSDFSKMDANHDGKVTKAEIEAFQRAGALAQIMARNQQIFRALDKDHNGQLSPAEFAQFHAEPPAPNAQPMLQRFDANHDGVITQVEFRAATLANFDRLDTDKDGVVTAAEMRAAGIGKH
jgi:Ca2+-binding EF-hand superfamily protein